MRNSRFLAASLAVLMCTFAAAAWGQSGSISGIVTDQTGAVIPTARVTARDVEKGTLRSATTNTQGFYEFLALTPSTYELTVEAAGFGKARKSDINVVVGMQSHFDVTLTPGNVVETVEVRTEVPMIEPEKTNISHAVELAQIQSLPLQGRQFTNLALLTPGVTPQAPGTQAGDINVAGMRSQSNNWTLNGVSNN